jgi:hypothetical protein
MSRDTKEVAKAVGYFIGVSVGISLVCIAVQKVVGAVLD